MDISGHAKRTIGRPRFAAIPLFLAPQAYYLRTPVSTAASGAAIASTYDSVNTRLKGFKYADQ